VYSCLSEFKALINVRIMAPSVKKAKQKSVLKQVMDDNNIADSESDGEEFNKKEPLPTLDKTILICGDIQDIESVFSNDRGSQDDMEGPDLQDARRKAGDHIGSEHKVPITIYLKNTVFAKLVSDAVIARIFRAFRIEFQPGAMINQYQFLALNAFLKFHSLSFEQLIIIWPRIFDPKNLGRISFEELHHFLDELSRGKLT
jgi:hypothetical protein